MFIMYSVCFCFVFFNTLTLVRVDAILNKNDTDTNEAVRERYINNNVYFQAAKQGQGTHTPSSPLTAICVQTTMNIRTSEC